LLNLVAAGILLGSLVVASPVAQPAQPAARKPPDERVTIDKLKVNGSGCKHDTTAVAVSPDKEAFTVTYSAYIAKAGGGAKPKDQQKSCSITVRLNVPDNVTYAVSAVDYRGYARLRDGASAALSSTYQFKGHGTPVNATHSFPSLLDDDWQVTDQVPPGGLVYGPCGKERKLDLDSELSVNAASSGPDSPVSMIMMDSTDGSFTSRYRLAWKSCP
jgi:uncharacterized protein DUF4360